MALNRRVFAGACVVGLLFAGDVGGQTTIVNPCNRAYQEPCNPGDPLNVVGDRPLQVPVPPSGSPDPCQIGATGSPRLACWQELWPLYNWDIADRYLVTNRTGLGFGPEYIQGYRGHRGRLSPPFPGTFMPVGESIEDSSLPLVPDADSASPLGWQGLSRPTLSDQVDLVTGVPLARVVDLELPMDGAKFRLSRTRSAIPLHMSGFSGVRDSWWDWTGEGWMAGENPLLVVDAAMPDSVGDDPRQCWLVLDAHHTIPFQQIESSGAYEAPPRFKARITHNGTWGLVCDPVRDPTTQATLQRHGWVVPPTTYTVWLQNGKLKYTFAVQRDSIPATVWDRDFVLDNNTSSNRRFLSSLDERPYLFGRESTVNPYNTDQNPGVGYPSYGLCTSIEDRYGHTVEMTYCGVTGRTADDPGSPDCIECSQNCLAKGQLKTITLKTGGVTKWSLLYIHRVFADPAQNPAAGRMDQSGAYPYNSTNAPLYETHGRIAIDRIYAFPGEFPVGVSSLDCLTFHHDQDHWSIDPARSDLRTTGAIDAVESHNVAYPSDPWKWSYLVRYHYEATWQQRLSPLTALPQSVDCEHRHWVFATTADPGLVLTTSWTAQWQGSNATFSMAPTLYWWKQIGLPSSNWLGAGFSAAEGQRWLAAIFRPNDVSKLLGWITRPPTGVSFPEADYFDGFRLPELALGQRFRDPAPDDCVDDPGDGYYAGGSYHGLWGFFSTVIADDEVPGSQVNLYERMLRFASVRWDRGNNFDWSGSGATEAPSQSTLVTYPGTRPFLAPDVPIGQLVGYNGPWSSRRLDVREGTTTRYFAIHHILSTPEGSIASPPSSGFAGNSKESFAADGIPFNSMYVAPFRWQTYPSRLSGGTAPNPRTDAPNLQKARWITIVDELDSAKAFEDSYDTSTGLRPRQISRRVVELNASGVILRDRTWNVTNGQSGQSVGSGLGEQYIYKSVQELSDQGMLGAQLPPVPPGTVLPSGVRPVRWNPFYTAATDTNDEIADLRKELMLIEHRSVGWSAADLASSGAADGLIHTFDYKILGASTTPWVSRIQQTSEGIKKGLNGSTYLTKQWLRDADNPSEVLTEVEFLDSPPTLALASTDIPALDPAANQGALISYLSSPSPNRKISMHGVERSTTSGVPAEEQRVLSRIAVGPAQQQRPNGAWYFPVDKEFYSENGSPIWSATGLVLDPRDPSTSTTDPLSSLTFTYYDRDDQGRTINSILDAGTAGSNSATIIKGASSESVSWTNTGLPSQWRRIPQSGALNFVTSFEYNGNGELTDTYFPNGRRTSRRYLLIYQPLSGTAGGWSEEPVVVREYVFKDLAWNGSNWVAESPGEVNDYPGGLNRSPSGNPIVKRKVVFGEVMATSERAGNYMSSSPPAAGLLSAINPQFIDFPFPENQNKQPEWREHWKLTFFPDANGRLQKADLLERMPDGTFADPVSKEVNDLIDVLREREMDGTITRTTRNRIGQPIRTYVGVGDNAWTTSGVASGLALLSLVEYGTGSHDAWLPVIHRRYETNPTSWANDPFSTPPAWDSDPDAIVSRTLYDWRMRSVRTDSYKKGIPSTSSRLETTLTFLDHADRPRLVVSYGTGMPTSLPAGLDPVTAAPGESVPSAAAFLGSGAPTPRPKSVTEMIYGPDGTVNQRRVYDMKWTGSGTPAFLADLDYKGRGGASVFTASAGGNNSVTTLDGVGRVATSATIEPGRFIGGVAFELTRSDQVYDPAGNVIETVSWERAKDDGVAVLSLSNAVRSRVLQWYDAQRRLIASADLGTEQYTGASSGYVAGPANFVRPTTAPSYGTSVNRNGVPADAHLSIYQYDINGNQVASIDPEEVVTRTVYSSSGRVIKRIENADDSNASARRETQYDYAFGRLVAMRAQRSVSPLVWEETKVEYTADVLSIDTGTTGTMRRAAGNGGVVGRLRLPNPAANQASAYNDMNLRYDYQGRVAERIDRRGVVLRYRYDDLGRLSSVEVGHYPTALWDPTTFIPGYPVLMNQPLGAPVDRIGYVEYSYDGLGNLTDVGAYDVKGGTVITQNRYAWDERGNLLSDAQSLGETIGTSTPTTNYAWTYQAMSFGSGGTVTSTGTNRLDYMVYPLHDLDRRRVTLGYGAAGSTSQALSRLETIATDYVRNAAGGGYTVTTPTSPVSSFGYAGTSRRISTSLAGDRILSSLKVGTSPTLVGFDGLSAFGQITNLHYKNSASTPRTLYQAEYSYDSRGNRITGRVTQSSASGAPRVNERSQVNTYDNLGRLVSSDIGAIAASGSTPAIDPAARYRTDTWTLDLLGNWVGGAPTGTNGPPNPAGRFSTGNLDNYGEPFVSPFGANASPDSLAFSQKVNNRNEIDYTTTQTNGGSPVNTCYDYDAAGNLINDGSFYYQYDAWNRLIQVNRIESEAFALNAATPSGDENQSSPCFVNNLVTVLIKHHTYDGLGRLVRAQTPFPDPDTSMGELRSERFYYDGIRRVQEVIVDPIMSIELALNSGSSQLQAAATNASPNAAAAVASGQLDASATPLALEGELTATPAEASGTSSSGFEFGDAIALSRMEREYIWGPGDRLDDELLVQYDANRQPTWAIQDAGGDVVALCDTGLSGGLARVVGQWWYDAYGAVRWAEHLGAFPVMRVGHKGLFCDRLDGAITDSMSGAETPRLVPYAKAIYHARNRAYMPELGRWMQMDPNAAAMPLIGASAYHGRGLAALVAAFNVQERYGDGANLYQYLRGNPLLAHDALGLRGDAFDQMDEVIAGIAADRSAFLSNIGQSAKSAAVMAATIATYLPFPAANIAGTLALVALGEMSLEEAAAGAILGAIGGKALGVVTGFVGKIGAAAWNTAKKYAMGGARWLANKAGGLVARAGQFLGRKAAAAAGACRVGCFIAGTLVMTDHGFVPIESIEVGTKVLAIPAQVGGDGPISGTAWTGEPVWSEVTDTIRIEGAALLDVTLLDGRGVEETLATTDEHPFLTERGWLRADQLSPGTLVQTRTGWSVVDSLGFSGRRETVYNLAVKDNHTFLIGETGVWVHNCGFVDSLTEHVVTVKRHGWELMFGGRKPRLDEVRHLVMDAAQNGVPISELKVHGPNAWSQVVEKNINGHKVWADVFWDDSLKLLRVKNGGINP